MRILHRSLILAESVWAQHAITLDPEPPGDRVGVVENGTGAPLRLVAIGDSMVAGCGTDHQSHALTPRIAAHLSERTGRSVAWETHARLGATMRRVRHRFLPEVGGDVDVLFLCAGSNDVMANRSPQEWNDDLLSVLDSARQKASHVVLCSSGQLHHSPKLPRALRRELGRRIDEQTRISQELCAREGVDFADAAHSLLVDGFWAGDGFHPSAAGYEFAAGFVVESMSWVGASRE